MQCRAGNAPELKDGRFKQRLMSLRPGQRHGEVYGSSYQKVRVNPNEVCPTISKSNMMGHAELYHWQESRPLSDRELSRLASFGDWFRFAGSYVDAVDRIGNSVPPLLMRAIALQIKSVMFGGQPLTPFPKSMTYLDILEAAWKDHLAPRQPDAPTVISTFAGGGGSSLGYSMAGYRELLAVEWDNNAVETFRLNFPDVPVYHGDIAKLSVEECLRLAGIGPGELDVFDGSPPCQGFSTAGKRIIDDPRNQLFREYVRLLRGLRPKVFVMENVSGMVKGKMKLVFAEILRELKASGYIVSARLLNAMYFNVPQSRERMIFIGVREDLGIEPSHPKAEGRPVTVREALVDVVNIDMPPLDFSIPFSYVKAGKSVANSCPKSVLAQWFPRFINNKKFNFNSYAKRVEANGQFPSIEKTYKDACPIHPVEHRHFTIDEIKRGASYPDKFLFCGKFIDKWERIGNSVPPLMMRSISRPR